MYPIGEPDNILSEDLNSNSQEFKINVADGILEYERAYTISVDVTNPNLEGIEKVNNKTDF